MFSALDRSLKVFGLDHQNFLNVPRPSTFFFCLNNNFQTKKFDALRRSFDWKLISPIMSKDTLRNIFSFYLRMSQIFSYCSVGKDLRKFHKISLCSKSPYFDRATLNKFSCIYLTETHAQWNSCFHIRKRETVVV